MPEIWKHAEGDRPHTVTVYERSAGGPLYARCSDPSVAGGIRRVSLGHRDKRSAKRYAREQVAKLEKGEAAIRGKVTLAQVLAARVAFLALKPKRTQQTRAEDERHADLWVRVLGADLDPHKVSLGQWQEFIRQRAAGEIDGSGRPVGTEYLDAAGRRRTVKSRSVRNRKIERELRWLRWAFTWATRYRGANGTYLMEENPLLDVRFEIPKEANPKRPVATQDRYDAMREAAEGHTMDVRWNGHRTYVRSYMLELLDLCHETGHRIGAVRQLRYSDLVLGRVPNAPHGAIRWPEETDKQDHEHGVPISPIARAALDRVLRDRPGVGQGYLFPSQTDLTRPVAARRVQKWWSEVETLAELEPMPRGKWHTLRRKWATERKHLPDVDVAATGGWKTVETMRACYQKVDPETMLSVVLDRHELRQVR